MADKVRMECPKCGYKCTPQWLNDEAHCLKCQAVLRRRAAGSSGPGMAVNEQRRQVGEASTYKAAPSSAMESEGGTCSKSPTGVHHWKFGKCGYCQMAEPPKPSVGRLQRPVSPVSPSVQRTTVTRPVSPVSPSAGAAVRPSSVGRKSPPASPAPGKLCDKCQKPFNGHGATCGACRRTMNKQGSSLQCARCSGFFWGYGDVCEDCRAGDGMGMGTASLPRNDRSKIVCQFCGYKCVPQWLNDEAHCLKCDKVVKTQPSIHVGGRGTVVSPTGVGRRQPGEAATHKFWTAGSAMESSSGNCGVSPDGVHHWRFGKCTYCQVGEGKLVKKGTMLNPGTPVGSCDVGGKCIFKFAKCTKCGRSEY